MRRPRYSNIKVLVHILLSVAQIIWFQVSLGFLTKNPNWESKLDTSLINHCQDMKRIWSSTYYPGLLTNHTLTRLSCFTNNWSLGDVHRNRWASFQEICTLLWEKYRVSMKTLWSSDILNKRASLFLETKCETVLISSKVKRLQGQNSWKAIVGELSASGTMLGSSLLGKSTQEARS